MKRHSLAIFATGATLLAAQDLPHPPQPSSAFLPFEQAGAPGRDDADYQAGTGAIDAGHFEDAVRRFDAVIARKSSRADGAYYWKAYAQSHSGRNGQALATLATLRKAFPQSKWLDDANALEVELHAQNGRPVSPSAENNEDLKLIAINSLMESDPNRAFPILRGVLSGNQPAKLKDRALFVLAQSGAPEARQLLVDIARGKTDPALQSSAVRYLSMMGGDAARKQLAEVYASSNDVNLKREIIRGYLLSDSKRELLQAAQSEKNEDLQREAIRTLAQTGAKDELWTLYRAQPSPSIREEIVRSMLLDGDSAHLLEIVKTERDPTIRKSAIQTLALTGWGKDNSAGSNTTFAGLYRSESDESIKRALIQALFLQGNAKGLVELARQETNPALKREIVQQLSVMGSKESTEYMMEILK